MYTHDVLTVSLVVGVLILCVAIEAFGIYRTSKAVVEDGQKACPCDIEKIIYDLNVVTNVLIAIPCVMLFIMGFFVPSFILFMCVIFSCLWHATNHSVFRILDVVFAVLAGLCMCLGFLNISLVRGIPEMTSILILFPPMCLIIYRYKTLKETMLLSDRVSKTEDRIYHIVWHILVAFTFIVVCMELQRCHKAIPNRLMADTIHAKDILMKSNAPPSCSFLLNVINHYRKRKVGE
jgi:hypothetical protein